jgi:heat shock protein HslJ
MATAIQRFWFASFLFAALASCANGGDVTSAPALESSYWKLVELNGKPVTTPDNQHEAHIILRGGQPPALSGSGGCNRLMGSYTLAGDTITFGRAAMTMMACPEGMDTEQAFIAVLEGTKHWHIDGSQLLLLDDAGKTVVRFEVVYLK